MFITIQVMSTTVSAMAAISPLLPTGLFTGVAVVSGLMSLVTSHLASYNHYIMSLLLSGAPRDPWRQSPGHGGAERAGGANVGGGALQLYHGTGGPGEGAARGGVIRVVPLYLCTLVM